MDQTPLWQWQAYDAHPHRRNGWWVVAFLLIIIGIILYSIWRQDWAVVGTFVVVIGIYWYMHKGGHKQHSIQGFEQGILIDDMFLPWEYVEGFWFTYDPNVQVLHLPLSGDNASQEIHLQMGDLPPDWFRIRLTEIGLQELEREETTIDQILRFLKL